MHIHIYIHTNTAIPARVRVCACARVRVCACVLKSKFDSVFRQPLTTTATTTTTTNNNNNTTYNNTHSNDNTTSLVQTAHELVLPLHGLVELLALGQELLVPGLCLNYLLYIYIIYTHTMYVCIYIYIYIYCSCILVYACSSVFIPKLVLFKHAQELVVPCFRSFTCLCI